MISKVISVEGMSCDHCVQTVQKALSELAGVEKVVVSLENKQVSVDFDDSQVGLAEISAKITKAGYEVAN
ncbi:MAG: heavy-metal-associated domain-containing protein [Nitrospinales bacterium]